MADITQQQLDAIDELATTAWARAAQIDTPGNEAEVARMRLVSLPANILRAMVEELRRCRGTRG